jgi:signal peptidase II
MLQTTPNSSSSDRSGTDKTSAASPQNNKPGLGQFLWCIPLVAVLIIIDQITKRIAVNVLADGLRIPLINGVLEFTFVQNRGAAFGIMQNALPFFVVITLAALCVITYFLLHIPSQKRYLPLRICLCFIAAGAIGNFIDRLRLSYVRDFIYFSLIDFPVFNVADIYITCATILLVLLMLFYYRDEDDFSLLK